MTDQQRDKREGLYGNASAPIFELNDNRYTVEKGDEVIRMLTDGAKLAQICSRPDMPSIRYLYEWRKFDKDFDRRFKEARMLYRQSRQDLTFEAKLDLCDEFLSEYGTTSRSLRSILEDSPEYPTLLVFNGWSSENGTIKDMRHAAEECRAVLLAEEAMERADALEATDPRAVNLQIRVRQWLAERFWRAKFGQQQPVAVSDDLANMTQSQVEQTLNGLVSELKSAGIELKNVH